MSFYGKELQSRLSWRQWKQDMSDKITKNVIDECNTHTMCLAKTFPEEKNNRAKRKKRKPKINNRSGILVSTFHFS